MAGGGGNTPRKIGWGCTAHLKIINLFKTEICDFRYSIYGVTTTRRLNDKWIKLSNFKLDNEICKVNLWTYHERGTKKTSESPTGIEPWPPEHWAGAVSTELRELMENKVV